MIRQHSFHQVDVPALFEFVDADHRWIEPRPEAFVLVEDKDFTATHPGSEVLSSLAKDHHHSACHVLASMISDALDDGHRTGIAHRKPFAGHAIEISLTAGGPIQNDVPNNNILR